MHRPSRGAFQRSLTLLVRYRSRGVFSLRGRCPRHSRGISNPRYSRTGAHSTELRYGTVALFRALFQETSRSLSSAGSQPVHHMSLRIRFGLYRVHSRLLTTSQLLSLPVLTKMFQFRTFPIARGNCGGDSHSEILSSMLPCSSLRLIAAWHVLLRHSSRAIHQPA